MSNFYEVGDLVRCTGTFTDADGNAQDPTTIYFKVRDPSANITSYQYGVDAELVKSATGIYYVDVDGDEAGQWWYRFYATGTGQSADETDFVIEDSVF